MTTLLRTCSLTTVLSVLLLLSCKEDEEVIVVNRLNAQAGQDQQAKVNVLVTLDGSASSDGNNKPFTYEWSFKAKPSQSNAMIQSSTASVAQFTPDKSGLYNLQLLVRQNNFLKTDDVVITVTEDNTEPEPATILINDNITSDRVLEDVFTDPQLADYRISADVKVNGRLTIKPGIVVEFDQDKSLAINPEGSIIAEAETDNTISFRGKENRRGYWKGILINSNNSDNIFKYVTVSDAGSGLHLDMTNGTLANVLIAGTNYSGGSLKIMNSLLNNGNGYGLFVQGKSELPIFTTNYFSNNSMSAVYVPASLLHVLDNTSVYHGNGFDGIETGGVVNHNETVTWRKLQEGSKYLVSSDLLIESGVTVSPGSLFEFGQGVVIDVHSNGFFNAIGTSDDRIIFTSVSQLQHQYWTGILYRTSSDMNVLDYVEISRAGVEDVPVFTAIKANVSVAGTGKAFITNSTIGNGLGWGVAAEFGSQINENVSTANLYINLPEGNVKLPVTEEPETTTLVGDWVDLASFNKKYYSIDPNFYNEQNNVWFGGALDPWATTPPAGFGLRILENGDYVWTIAERGPLTGCASYNAEHVEGQLTFTLTTISFVEEFWRSKFHNSCDPSQNADINVEPGGMSLQYQVTRMYDVFTGEPNSWELKIFNPDGSSFTYYRK